MAEVEVGFLGCLRATDVKSHDDTRPGIIEKIELSIESREESKLVGMFWPLLPNWYSISSDARRKITALPPNSTFSSNETSKLTFEYFEKFLASGLSQLANLPDNWESVFGSGMFTLL